MNCDVLLFGTMADIGPVVLSDLEKHGLSVELTDFPQNTFRDFWGYGRGLSKAVERLHPGMVIPIGDALALSKLAPSLPDGTRAAVDREENIALLSSKVRTYELARELGIEQPRRYGTDDLPPEGQAIFKRDRSFGGSGVHRPWNNASLLNLVAHENGAPCLIEEYVEGEDLSADCVRGKDFFRAECYLSLGRNYTQGPSAQRLRVLCPEAVEVARVILDAIDYRGVCGLDFRRTAEGRLCFLECNPRFTGGIRTQIEGGFDIPVLLYELMNCAE